MSHRLILFFFFNDTATTEIYTLSLHDALPILRRGGHVQPERAAEDLPKAVVAIREEGLDVPMITTELTSADDPAARVIFSTAAKLSIPFFKPGYYQYKMVNVRRELEEAAGQFRGLVTLSKQYGIQAGYP